MIRIRKSLLIIICFFLMMGLISFYPNNFNINIKTDGIYLKSEINIDVLKQVAAKNLSSDDLEKMILIAEVLTLIMSKFFIIMLRLPQKY